MSIQPQFNPEAERSLNELFTMDDMKQYLGDYLGLPRWQTVKDVVAERVIDYAKGGTFIEEGVRGTITIQGLELEHDSYIYDVYETHNPFSPEASAFLADLAMTLVPTKIVHDRLPITRTIMAPQHPRIRTILGTRLFYNGLGLTEVEVANAEDSA
jgi:hypothetical protein